MEKHPVLADLGGIQTPYTEAIRRILQSWPPSWIDFAAMKASGRPASLRCFSSVEDDLNVGLLQIFWAEAPIARVAEVTETFELYPAFIPNLNAVERYETDGNRWKSRWEQSIPLPFVPNARYVIHYIMSAPAPGKRVYRYQLAESNRLTHVDGFIYAEEETPGRTRVTELDFSGADWGIVKALGARKIWNDVVDGYFVSDLAMKARMEHADWTGDDVREYAEREGDKFDHAACIRDRGPLPIGGSAQPVAKASARP